MGAPVSGAESRHRLRAILSADAAGYSRLMAVDEVAALAALDDARQVFAREVPARGGRIVDTAGDSVLSVFESTAAAVDAALAIQQQLEAERRDVDADKRLRFRVGVHLGDVVERSDGTVYGNGVNVAARLQSLADPGSVCASDAVRNAIAGSGDRMFEDLGRHAVKNIAEPVQVFRLLAPGSTATVATPRDRSQRRLGLAAAAALAALGVGSLLWLATARPWQAAPVAPATPGPLPMSVAIARIAAPPGDTQGAEVAETLRRDLTAGLTRPGRSNQITVLPAMPNGAVPAPRTRTRYVVEGALTRDGEGHLAQLSVVETDSGRQKWSKQVPLPSATPALQRTIASKRLADEVAGVVWDSEVVRLLPLPVEKMSPIELVVRSGAAYDARPNLEGIDEAMKLANRALALDPNFVPALLNKAFLVLNRYDEEVAPDHDRVTRDLDTLSARALAVDSRDPTAWYVRANALLFLGRWASAREAIEKRVQLDPDSSSTPVVKSEVLLYLGEADEVLKTLDVESSKAGGHAWAAIYQCKAYLLLSRSKEAVPACERGIGRDPVAWSAHLFLAAAHANLGNLDKARASLKAVEQMSPGYTLARLRSYRQAAHPEFQRQAEAHYYPGLRKAGMPER